MRVEASPGRSLAYIVLTPLGLTISRLLIFAVLIGAWQFAPFGKGMELWVSRPSLILATLWRWIVQNSLWPHVGTTLGETVAGYLIGCVSGIVVGVTFGVLPRVSRFTTPYFSALYALPKIALAPLFIIVFGIGLGSKIALVAITVFFLIYNSTLDGVRNVDRDLVSSVRLMGATGPEIIWKILLPSAQPWIYTGMRIAVRYAFTSALLAELIAANRGLGFLIEYHSGIFDTTGAYASILILVVCSVVLTEALTLVERLTSTAAKSNRRSTP